MIAHITEERKFALVGLDFYGKPCDQAGGWKEDNAVGRLWERFERFFAKGKDRIKHLVSEDGYELWYRGEEEREDGDDYIFVGVEVERIEEVPLELVAKMLPETRYAVFTLKGGQIKSDWHKEICEQWVPQAGLCPSVGYILEHYDPQRFKGPDDPESELEIFVPVK